ncbi:MAG TPA: formylglycine-generating enzyme family protein [bacterium]|nr:formylglycine-generating enzyme family protein [bacterium]
MKKLLISLVFISVFLMISCGDSNTGDTGNTGNTGDTGNSGNTGNTGNTGDTGNDSDSVDTGDTGNTGADMDLDDTGNTADDSDTDTEDTGDTADDSDSGNSGNTGTPEGMVSVPAGSFQMGCNKAVDDQCGSNESPYHEVTLSAYKIDKYEVTTGDYQKCVDAGDCNNDNGDEPHYSICNLETIDRNDHPMNCVSWYGAKAYCEWAGKRLPTEAEWEKAARGTDGRTYPWGNTPEASCDHAVINDENAGGQGCGEGGTMPVGSKPLGISPYGAYDMIGNVWEWTNDWYEHDYYETTPSENPAGPESGVSRVLRGGSWSYDFVVYFRASLRVDLNPDRRFYSFGFRCAK